MTQQNNMTVGHSSRRAKSSRGKVAPIKRNPAPVVVSKPNPIAWKHAMSITNGDHTRCVAQPDGSVIVYNHSRR